MAGVRAVPSRTGHSPTDVRVLRQHRCRANHQYWFGTHLFVPNHDETGYTWACVDPYRISRATQECRWQPTNTPICLGV
jgi:hypothetical protein